MIQGVIGLYCLVERYISKMGFSRTEGEEVRKSIHIKINLLQVYYQKNELERIAELEKRFDEISMLVDGKPAKKKKKRSHVSSG
jgi:hypothetical protein